MLQRETGVALPTRTDDELLRDRNGDDVVRDADGARVAVRHRRQSTNGERPVSLRKSLTPCGQDEDEVVGEGSTVEAEPLQGLSQPVHIAMGSY